MARLWNGYEKLPPLQQPFLMLTTPVSFYHRLKNADDWADLGLLVLDEVHNKCDLMYLILAFVDELFKRRDPRVQGLRVLLNTATASGAAVMQAERLLEEARVERRERVERVESSWRVYLGGGMVRV